MPERIVDWLLAWRWPLLVVGVLLTIAAFPLSRQLAFNRSIEAMFAPDDPLLGPYRKLKRIFGGDEIALAAYVDPHLLDAEGLDRLDRLTAQLREVPGVVTAFSLTSSPVLGKHILESPLRDKFLRLCEGYTLGPDHQTAGVACLLTPLGEGSVPRRETIDRLRSIVEAHDRTGVLTGEPVLVLDGFRHLEADGRLLGATSTALLMLVIVICFRSVRWVIVPLAVMLATLVWTQALLSHAGFRLSMVSSMLWALVTVICVGTVMHVIVGYGDARRAGVGCVAALRGTGVALLAPVFWSCATDAAGFGSLMFAHVGPVIDFGAMMALASGLALVAMAMFLPGLILLGARDEQPPAAASSARLNRSLAWLASLIEQRPGMLALVLTVGTLAAMAGIPRLRVETDFTRNFRSDSPLVQAYTFVESRLGGAGLLDVIVPVSSTVDAELLARLRKLEERLQHEVIVADEAGRDVPGLTKTMSLADVLDVGLGSSRLQSIGLEAQIALLKQTMPLAGALVGNDADDRGRTYLRIMLRARERQPAAEKQRLIDQVTRISQQEFAEAEVTGFFVLLTHMIESVSQDQWLTFGAATVGIAIMLLVAFRRPMVAMVALIPNALPILVVTGVMGWLG
ncbi:MAG TPA: MMPL family transporter, partial [Pirellulales bacterium]|nr:MMPL family transporter [Pirellulales bacterium]